MTRNRDRRTAWRFDQFTEGQKAGDEENGKGFLVFRCPRFLPTRPILKPDAAEIGLNRVCDKNRGTLAPA